MQQDTCAVAQAIPSSRAHSDTSLSAKDLLGCFSCAIHQILVPKCLDSSTLGADFAGISRALEDPKRAQRL